MQKMTHLSQEENTKYPSRSFEQVLEFSLVEGRSYVRATDLLDRLLEIFPGREIEMRFLRPLKRNGVLSDKRLGKTHVWLKVEGKTYFLTEQKGDVPMKTLSKQDTSQVFLSVQLGKFFFFLFSPTSSLVSRLSSCIDYAHPKLGTRLVIRKVVIDPKSDSRFPAYLFNLALDREIGSASLTARTLMGRFFKVEFSQNDSFA